MMNNTLHTMILNCFIKWCSMNRVIFCLIDALKNARPENFFIIAICDFFVIVYLIRRSKEKKYQKKNNYAIHFSNHASRLQRQW